jgi:hypothetical protein
VTMWDWLWLFREDGEGVAIVCVKREVQRCWCWRLWRTCVELAASGVWGIKLDVCALSAEGSGRVVLGWGCGFAILWFFLRSGIELARGLRFAELGV